MISLNKLGGGVVFEVLDEDDIDRFLKDCLSYARKLAQLRALIRDDHHGRSFETADRARPSRIRQTLRGPPLRASRWDQLGHNRRRRRRGLGNTRPMPSMRLQK
jgi:hypothetical protein